MEKILETVQYLSSPFDNSKSGDKLIRPAQSPSALLTSLIQNCPEELSNSNEYVPSSESSPAWRYTCLILQVLLKLKEAVEEAELHQTEQEKSIEVLSLQTQIQVQNCLEIVTGFGVLPYFLPSIGVPNKVRPLPNSHLFTSEDQTAPDLEKFRRLSHSIETLFNLASHPSLHQLIFPKHTPDILAALLQLTKTPLKKPDILSENLINPVGLTLEEYNEVEEKRSKLEPLLNHLLNFTAPSTLVSTLLLLGFSKKRWMSKSCNKIVYEIILSPEREGLHAISLAVLESMGQSNAWKVSRVVSNLVKESLKFSDIEISLENRVKNLAQQGCSIVNAINKSEFMGKNENLPEISERLSTVALVCGLTLLSSDEAITNQHFFFPLFHPLMTLQSSLESNKEGALSSQGLYSCLFLGEKLLSTTPSLDFPFPLKSFSFWPLLLQLYVCSKGYLGRKVQDHVMLEQLDMLLPRFTSVLIQLLETAEALSESHVGEGASENSENFSIVNFCVNLILNPGSSSPVNRYCFEVETERDEKEGVRFLGNSFQDSESLLETLSSDCNFLVSIVKDERLKSFRGKLFTQLMSTSNVEGAEIVKSDAILTELDLKERTQVEKFVRMELLSELGKDESILDDLGSMEDPLQMLQFLEMILRKLTLEIESSMKGKEEYEFSQSIIFSLTILTALCESVKKEKDFSVEWSDLKKFLPYLKLLRESMLPELIANGIPGMAEDVMTFIETKGMGIEGKKAKVMSRFETALENVGSVMVPVKGHGLLELRKLVEEKDEEALRNEKLILNIFLKELKDEDSYVYLMAVQGLAALGVKFHGIVVPILIEQYGFENEESERIGKRMKAEERSEFRLKIGEVLVRIVKGLGEFAGKYRVPITNVCFSAVRDEDPLVRASALSNLGELCHLLNFTLGVILTEVWSCVEAVLKTEKYVEVRRAALHLVVLLLRGVEKEFSVSYLLGNEEIGRYLRDVRRVLAQIRDTEKDTVAGIHCQLALQELELIVKKIFTHRAIN